MQDKKLDPTTYENHEIVTQKDLQYTMSQIFQFLTKSKKQRVHFLHIGKTGGSAIKLALRDYLETPKYSLKLHGHDTSLKHIPKGDPVVFFLRDPVSRFVSGFYSRQRKGRPRYYSEWIPEEKEVFEHFSTPNEVAVALASGESLATRAMENVEHFRRYSYWYIDFGYFRSRLDDILFIGFQETLDAGFARLKKLLEVPVDVELPVDDVGAHRNPSDVDTSIDESGVVALRDWYSGDFEFVSMCKEIMSKRRSAR